MEITNLENQQKTKSINSILLVIMIFISVYFKETLIMILFIS